jgi:putative protease
MEIEIGRVTHFYNHLCVAVLSLTGDLKVGDTIHILGHVTDFTQPVGSMEIEHHKVMSVKPGDNVAPQVVEPVREHDRVYKVVEDIFEHRGA